ncbi:MAG: HNH endonuclease [Bacillota bacterium]
MAKNKHEKIGQCEMCGRDKLIITAHHLIPKTTHTSKYVKKNFSDERKDLTIDLCKACHKTLHATFTEKELARSYNTLDSLMKSELIAKFIKWVKKQPTNRKIKVNWTNNRRANNVS